MGLLARLFGGAGTSASSVDVVDARRRHDAGAVLIDVREPSEWRQGHVARARHIPLGSLASRLAEVPRDRDVLLICRSGNRSGSAQRLLQQHGYERVFNVSGGMTAWTRAGLPVKR